MASAAKPLVLRCKTRTGQHVLDSLTADNTVEDLKAFLFSLTSILPDNLRVLAGYPPKLLDLSNNSTRLGMLFMQSRESLIVEEGAPNGKKKMRIISSFQCVLFFQL